MSKPKRYRRKRNEFELVETRFDSLEAGPVVVLQPDDFDVLEVSFAEFNEDFEEVPEEEMEAEKDEIWGVGSERTLRAAEAIEAAIQGREPLDMVHFRINGLFSAQQASVREILSILDAARKSLAGGDAAGPEAAERCRVGEWVPGRLVGFTEGVVTSYSDEFGEAFLARHYTHKGYAGCHEMSRETWDAARARWIADGRPTS